MNHLDTKFTEFKQIIFHPDCDIVPNSNVLFCRSKGPEGRQMSDIQTYLTVETIIDLGGDFNWLQGLSSSK